MQKSCIILMPVKNAVLSGARAFYIQKACGTYPDSKTTNEIQLPYTLEIPPHYLLAGVGHV